MGDVEILKADGSVLTIPRKAVMVWQFEVLNLDTYRGLADWYQNELEQEAEAGD